MGSSWANGEVQHYTNREENSYVSDGTLKIVAKKEQYNFEGIHEELYICSIKYEICISVWTH